MAAAAAMQTSHPAQPGAPALFVRDQAITAPTAQTAPKARYSTPVARYSTTSPTPDRAYTPPRARPLTMNGSKSDQGGIDLLGGRRGRRSAGRAAVLRDLRVDRRDLRAALGRYHLAVIRRGCVVLVVRDVQGVAAVGPQLAQHAGVEVADRLERRVDALHGIGPGHRLQRVQRDLGLGKAHLAEAADATGDRRAVLLEDRLVQVHRRGVRAVGRGQLRVDEQLVVPLRPERLGQEV